MTQPTQRLFQQVVINAAKNGFVVTYVLVPEADDVEAIGGTVVFTHWTGVIDFLKKGVKA